MPTPKQVERQQRMLRAALNEFCRLGFHNANVDEIARLAGVGKGTLYRHFNNKEGLFLAVFNDTLDSLHSAITERADFTNFEKGARTAIRTYLEQIASNPEIFQFFRIFTADEHLADVELRRKLTDRYFSHALWAAKEVQQAQAQGIVRKDLDPEHLVYMLLGMIHFMVYHWLKVGKHEDLLQNGDLIADVIFHGIGDPQRKHVK